MKSGSKKNEEGCVKCGTCNTVCPVYLTTGNEIHSPRGKQHLSTNLQIGRKSNHYADIFSKCLLCGACNQACPRGLDTPQSVVEIRSELPKISGDYFLKYVSRKALLHPLLLSGLFRAGTAANKILGDYLPKESGLRLRLLGFEKEFFQLPEESFITSSAKESGDEQQQYKVNYFTGCLANHLQPEIAESTQFLVSKTTGSKPAIAPGQTCCGMAAMAAGRLDEVRDLAKKNIRSFEDNDLPILTSCSSCYFQLKTYVELFEDDEAWKERAELFTGRLREFSSFFLKEFAEKFEKVIGSSKPSDLKVYYHDPCHLRFKQHITKEPRELLKFFSGVDLQELPGGPQCCGQGGLFHLAHPDLAHKVLERLMHDYGALGATTVVTGCSGCLLQWQQGLKTAGKDEQAMHLAIFIARLMQ